MNTQPHYTPTPFIRLRSRQRQDRTAKFLAGTALLAASCAAPSLFAQSGPEDARLDKLEKENQALRSRLDSLENLAKKEGIVPSGETKAEGVKALSDITLTGFVQASYFYDFSTPPDRKSNGYLWNSSHNSFSLNKVKLTLASKPVERSGDNWDAAYRVSMMWGEDSSLVNTGGELQGLENLREAYVELNAPVGTGLNIRAGQLISLLNYESGDGGAANANFSQGFQWWYTGNGPSAGAQLGYNITDSIDIKARLQNGLFAGPVDSNEAKTFLGAIGIKPTDKTWISLVGFVGDESTTMSVSGGSVLAGAKITDAFGVGMEFDYFMFNPDGPVKADVWSIGGWFTYDFTAKTGLALRADYVDDQDGFGIPGLAIGGRPGTSILSTDTEGNLGSITLTFNWKPFPYVKVQPELRYDYTGYEGGFDGEETRFIAGAGVSFLF
jgi:hypothetical protein